MHGLKLVTALIIIVFVSGCQAIKPQVEPVKLSAEEIVGLFKGKTVESFNLISGTTSFTYYAPNGLVRQERFWEKRSGKWMVNANAEICLAMEGKPFSCRSVYLESGRYYKYRVRIDGEREKIIRYRQFLEGDLI